MRANDRRDPKRPRKRNTLTERVSVAFRERILAGEFPVGEKLPKEKDLIAEFEVSRTVWSFSIFWRIEPLREPWKPGTEGIRP